MIDYNNIPPQPRKGIKGEINNKFYTRGLFYEQAEDKDTALFALEDDEIEHNGKTLPCAALIYIYSKSEYDAMRKICGNMKQWELLKTLPWFAPVYERWKEEQNCVQRDIVKDKLLSTIKAGNSQSVAAARQLIQMIDGKQSGRPEKKKSANPIEEDYQRVVALVRDSSGDSSE